MKDFDGSRVAQMVRTCGRSAAQIALAFGAYGFLILTVVLADSPSVQGVPFGIAVLCLGVGGVAHLACVVVKKFPWLLPSDVGVERVERVHTPLVILAIVVPFAISWTSNETLYGALNPVGYWHDQASKEKEDDCELVRSTLTQFFEKYQVAVNKYNMGIATSAEVNEAAESLTGR